MTHGCCERGRGAGGKSTAHVNAVASERLSPLTRRGHRADAYARPRSLVSVAARPLLPRGRLPALNLP